MKHIDQSWAVSVCLAITLLLFPNLRAESLGLYCRYQSDPPRSQPLPGSGRHYAPSRQIDVEHLALDVTPDFKKRAVSGQATLRFRPITFPLETLRLDGVDLEVAEVTATAAVGSWHVTPAEVVIEFAQPIPAGQEASVTVRYQARPRHGLYFRTPEMGYPEGDTHLWTQGEPTEARHWFPSFDAPNEKFTSEVTCRVPEGMIVLSNGHKASEAKDENGLMAVRWVQDKPHVNYLITLVAGYFKSLVDSHNNIPMAFHTTPSQIDYAASSFAPTKEVMAFLEEETGVRYPWDKYDQVCVLDFHWGGMENTTLTTLNVSTLHTEETESIDSSQGLVAHELAHQWFGDLVTCKDWSEIWLNEGFATYYEALFDGHKHGRDQLLYRMHQSAQGIVGQANDTNAMVRRDFRVPEDQFGFLAYPKGSWILHMLRNQVGPDLYRQCVKTYLDRHRFGVVDTEDLKAVFEELSGRSFDLFFDQYVYHAHHPELTVQYNWDAKTKLAKLSVRQTQKLGPTVLLFHVPLTFRFKTASGTLDRTVTVAEASEDFYIPLSEAPKTVRVDPDVALLAKIDFKPAIPMLYEQLQDSTDTVGRLIAADQLGQRRETGAVDKLKRALQEDPFYGVRMEAARGLRDIGTDDAYQALTDSLEQPDARVRLQVVRTLSGFYKDATYQTLRGLLDREKNPEILSAAIQALGAYPKPEVRDTLLVQLLRDSFRNTLAEAAIRAMRGQDEESYIDPLLQYLRRHEDDFFFDRSLGQALETLAFLARDSDDKQRVFEYLLRHLHSLKDRVRLASINALGTLGEGSAVAALQTFVDGPQDRPERQAAERAVGAIRDQKPRTPELSNLRREVQELRDENKKLRGEFDDLKKQVEALGQADAAPPAAGAGAPKKK